MVNKEEFIRQALEKHNELRRLHGVADLVHNPAISKMAQAYAKHLASTRTLQHSNREEYGENIALHPSNHGSDATMLWYRENKLYDFNKPGFRFGIGHFTQVVWKDSKEVGFGIVGPYDDYYYIVANYYPSGNVIGKFKENVFPRLECNQNSTGKEKINIQLYDFDNPPFRNYVTWRDRQIK